MDRQQAKENLTRAVQEAYQAGLRPFEVQDAIADGAHDAGQLVQAGVARERGALEHAGLVAEELLAAVEPAEDWDV